MVTQELNLDVELANATKESEESLKVLQANGFVVDTSQWLTIKRYAEKYNLSTQVVTNWISRGIIPAESTMILEEFNDLRLVKDKSYKESKI